MAFVTIVISRSNDSDPDRRRVEDALAASLHAAGCNVLLVPHIYSLIRTDEAACHLSRATNDLVVVTWLYPRAARCTLHALGIDDSRIMKCHDLKTFSSPVEAGEAIRLEIDDKSSETPRLHEISQPARERWYPVLDYSRCIGCKQCFGFCLFGVYSVKGDRVETTSPDSCKNGCPACARVCPKGAILFPHCDDAAIAGEPGSQISRSADPVRAVLERARRKRNVTFNAPAGNEKPRQSEELDDLINALEDLDD